MPRAENSINKPVPALLRGAEILDLIASGEHLNAAEIGRRLGLAKSSVHGLLSTLVALDLLSRRKDNRYQIGPHVMRWANTFNLQSDLAQEFAAIWDRQKVLPGATITLSVREGAEVLYVAARNSDQSIGFNFRIGQRLPAFFTATGIALLSHLDPIELTTLLEKGWPAPLTPLSIQSIDELEVALTHYRRCGYSMDKGQVQQGMTCFGAAVMGANNQAIAGVAVSMLSAELNPEREALAVSHVRDIAEQLSKRLGAVLG